MPNHFHLLLEVNRTPLSKVMQSLLYRYTRHYNQRYRKVGYLFQGRSQWTGIRPARMEFNKYGAS
jgi:putative transposase